MHLYSEQYNIEFYHIPKNAMTAIIHTMGFDFFNNINPAQVFTVVREPFDRLVSAYQELCVRFKAQTQAREGLCQDISSELVYKIAQVSQESVNLFIEEIKHNGPFESHHLTQKHYLSINTRSIEKVNHFLDFSDLSGEMKRKLNIDISLPVVNRQTKTPEVAKLFEPYRDWINEFYKDDLKLYQRSK